MADDGTILIGKSEKPEVLLLKLANRHGLVTGATGTGKTVTLQVLAEGFSTPACRCSPPTSRATSPAFRMPGEPKPSSSSAPRSIGLEYEPDASTVTFWDVFGEQGHPIRATVSEMGPLLLSRLLDLNDVQEGVLNIAFRVADDRAAAARPQGSARHARLRRRGRGEGADDHLRQRLRPPRSAPSSAQLLVLENQGARSSSASRRSTSRIS
jgi:DNA helicase HerA-like ATPase